MKKGAQAEMFHIGRVSIGAPYTPANAQPTSQQAATSMKPHAAGLEAVVLDCIRLSGEGMTCDEVEAKTKMPHQTASARVRGLALDKRIRPSGKYRKTRSGRNAIVWVCT